MNQVLLFDGAPNQPPDPMREPDNRHPWGRRLMRPESPIEWGCNVCGETATICPFTSAWLFFRPQLAVKPKGPWHFDQVSHECEERAWQ